MLSQGRHFLPVGMGSMGAARERNTARFRNRYVTLNEQGCINRMDSGVRLKGVV